MHDALELPLLERGLYSKLGVPPPTGVLLHGPPGTGKTLIARSVCDELGIHVVVLGTAQLLSTYGGDVQPCLRTSPTNFDPNPNRNPKPEPKPNPDLRYVGDAEAALAGAFADARAHAPSVLFLDEVDGIGAGRDVVGSSLADSRLLAVLLTEMDGAHMRTNEPIVVLGLTNRPEALDAALRRRALRHLAALHRRAFLSLRRAQTSRRA